METKYKILSSGLLFVVFVAAIIVSAQGEAHGQIMVILKKLDANNKDMQSLRSGITLARYNDQLKKWDKPQTGKVSYLPKRNGQVMYARIDWATPIKESLAIIGDSYWMHQPELNVGYQGKTAQAKNSGAAAGPLTFLSMTRAQMNENYKASLVDKETLKDGTATDHILLVPRDASSNYRNAEIWVDSKGFPRQIKVAETDNDTTTILLTGIEKDVKIKADSFKIKFPRGTKVSSL